MCPDVCGHSTLLGSSSPAIIIPPIPSFPVVIPSVPTTSATTPAAPQEPSTTISLVIHEEHETTTFPATDTATVNETTNDDMIRTDSLDDNIIGPDFAKRGAFPYMVAMLIVSWLT